MSNKDYENKLYDEGYEYICGVDEVGRGCIAGSVYACAIIMKKTSNIEKITDSKKLTDKMRRQLFSQIINDAVCYNVASIDNETIDKINILEASRLAMEKAIEGLTIKPDYILTDAMDLPIKTPYLKIIHGDLLSYTISCASIIAKVVRDDKMIELSNAFPEYAWNKNKGYPTKVHKEALKKYGVTKYHRLSYQPVKEVIIKNND